MRFCKISKRLICTLPIYLTVMLHLSASGAHAQCEECGIAADFCYSDERFQHLCAAYTSGSDRFTLVHHGNSRSLPILKAGDFDGLLQMVIEERPELSGIELLFVAVALQAWEQAERDIGMEFSDSGLGIKIIEQGNGPLTQSGQSITVHYTGSLEDGKVFDSSVQRGDPIKFALGSGRVIRGWDLGLVGLAVGTKALLKIPPQLAYGSQGAGNAIPANAVLYFEVEIVAAE